MLIANELMDAARTQTGLEDFGNDYFREGLEKFLDCIATDVALNDYGEMAVRARTVLYLANRLQVEHWYRTHPEIDDEQIVAPLFGLGLPRTGSTVLQCLLAEDPTARSLRIWESEKPCPPPETATEHTDPRIAAAEKGLCELHRMAPMIKKMLPLEGANDPTECQDLLGLSLRSQAFLATIMPTYIDWLISTDMEPAYRYHKRALKLLQWRCPPKRWRLKSPVHMLNLDALYKVYPDARFVTTHRDVAHSIPSMAALISALGQMFLERTDSRKFGHLSARIWEIALRRMIDFRGRIGEKRFYDIGFQEIQVDPIGRVRKLYDWLGEPFTPDFERRMRAWREAHRKGKHGEYKIDPEDFGLSPGTLHIQYAFYMDRYRPLISPA